MSKPQIIQTHNIDIHAGSILQVTDPRILLFCLAMYPLGAAALQVNVGSHSHINDGIYMYIYIYIYISCDMYIPIYIYIYIYINQCHISGFDVVYSSINGLTAIFTSKELRVSCRFSNVSSRKLVLKTVESCFVVLNYYEDGSRAILCHSTSCNMYQCIHIYQGSQV